MPLPLILATDTRTLYDSESLLLSEVSGAMGPEWAEKYGVALGVSSSMAESMEALDLWEASVELTAPPLSESQRAVAGLARRGRAGKPGLP